MIIDEDTEIAVTLDVIERALDRLDVRASTVWTDSMSHHCKCIADAIEDFKGEWRESREKRNNL